MTNKSSGACMWIYTSIRTSTVDKGQEFFKHVSWKIYWEKCSIFKPCPDISSRERLSQQGFSALDTVLC